MTTCWRKEIAEAMKSDDDGGPIIACTLDDAGLDKDFDPGYGGTNGAAFTAWTAARVYFPGTYDGAEWCDSVPRNPCDEAKCHVGGG